MLALKEDLLVFYPESDGKPMAETDVHRILLLKMVELLQNAFPERYASGNICLYYEQGNPRKMISPDALLCRGQPKQEKRVYKAWEEQAQLDIVIELSSFSTKREDHFKKKRIYEEILRVPYYVIFDPHGIYLQVFHLEDGKYRDLDTDEQGHYHMDDLGLQVAIEQANSLRLFDAQGLPILSDAEREAQRAEQEAQRAEREAQRAEREAQHAKQVERIAKSALAEQERLRKMLLAAGINPDSH